MFVAVACEDEDDVVVVATDEATEGRGAAGVFDDEEPAPLKPGDPRRGRGAVDIRPICASACFLPWKGFVVDTFLR